LKAAADPDLRNLAARQAGEECAGRLAGIEGFQLDGESGAPEPGREPERENAVGVGDAVEADEAVEARLGELRGQPAEGALEERHRRAPEQADAHAASQLAEVAGEVPPVLEEELQGLDELPAVEETADADLHAF
jgi:hypothetical protein